MTDEFITTSQLRDLLAERGITVSRRTLTKWVNDGRITVAGVLPNGRFLFDRREVIGQIIQPHPSAAQSSNTDSDPAHDEPMLPLFGGAEGLGEV